MIESIPGRNVIARDYYEADSQCSLSSEKGDSKPIGPGECVYVSRVIEGIVYIRIGSNIEEYYMNEMDFNRNFKKFTSNDLESQEVLRDLYRTTTTPVARWKEWWRGVVDKIM